MDRVLLFDLHQPQIIIPEPNTSAMDVAKECLPPGTMVRISLLDSPPDTHEGRSIYQVVKYDYCRQLLRLQTVAKAAGLAATDEETPQTQLQLQPQSQSLLDSKSRIAARQELEAKEEVEAKHGIEAMQELGDKQELDAKQELLDVSEDAQAKGDGLANRREVDPESLDVKPDMEVGGTSARSIAPLEGGGAEASQEAGDEVPRVILVDLRYCCKLEIIGQAETGQPQEEEDVQEPTEDVEADGVEQKVELREKEGPSTPPHSEHEDIAPLNEEEKENLDIEQDINQVKLVAHEDDGCQDKGGKDEESKNEQCQDGECKDGECKDGESKDGESKDETNQPEVPDLLLEVEGSECGNHDYDFDDDPSFQPGPLVLELRRLLRRELPHVGKIRCQPDAITVDQVIIHRPYLAINVTVQSEPEVTPDTTNLSVDNRAPAAGQLLAEIRSLVHQFHEEFILVLMWRRLRYNEAVLETPRFDQSSLMDNPTETDQPPDTGDEDDDLLRTDPEPEPETEPEPEETPKPAKKPRRERRYANFHHKYEYVVKKVDTAPPEAFLSRLRQIQADKMRIRQLEMAKARLEENRRLGINRALISNSSLELSPRPRRPGGHRQAILPCDPPKDRDTQLSDF